MKRNWKNKLVLLLLVAAMALVSCGQRDDHAAEVDTYTCPMHPTVVADRPGTCPVCGMDLVRKARPGEEVEITEDLGKLTKSPNETVIASIRTIRGEFKIMPLSVAAEGIVTYDTRKIYTIPSRVTGRLEQVYLKSAFQPVTAGQKIAGIYSPELLTAQRELLFLLENDADNTSLIDATKNKLSLLGMSAPQIDDLVKTGEPRSTFEIYSPYSGYLITGEPAPSTPASMAASATTTGDAMGSSSSANAGTSSPAPGNTSASLIREGNYVSAGQTLFTIVNTNALRIELDLPGAQSGMIKTGNNVELDFGDGHAEDATVDFVQPFFNEGQEFLKIRVYTKKVKDLHIGHLVKAKIQLPPLEALWVPKESVLDLGAGKIVFVKDRGVFKARKVTTGITAAESTQIKSGLASSEEIAANAQYLVDSESFIKPVK
jgi:membrane fusion protein, copper/silver efflux system